MDEYIERDDIWKRYRDEWEKQDICDGMEDTAWLKRCIEEAPAADVVPVVHGRWEVVKTIPLKDSYTEEVVDEIVVHQCSNCKTRWEFYWSERKFGYCFECGAKMDLEVSDGNM